MEHPLPFGFTYTFEGKEYAFDVLASSLEEAQSRIAAMARAELFGPLKPAENTTHMPAGN